MIKSIFQNIFLIGLTYSYFLVRGKARSREIIPIKKIVIMPTPKLGDLVCATPLLKAVKNYNGTIEVVLVATETFKPFFSGHPDIDNYFVWDEKRIFKNIANLRKLKADAAIVVSPSFGAIVCFFLAGISIISVPKVVDGFCPYQTKSYRILLPLFTVIPHHMGQYAPREYLKLLEPFGITTNNTVKHLTYSASEMESVNNKISQLNKNTEPKKFMVGIAPGVGNTIKQWNPAHFAQIAKHLIEKYDALVFIIGTKYDSKLINQMKESLPESNNIIDTTSRFDLGEIKAFISTLDLLIGVDTGVIYIAEAFDTPTIDIIGSVHENEQPPHGDIHKLVYLPGRKAEIHIMNSRVYNREIARKHIDDITPEMVYPFIKELLV